MPREAGSLVQWCFTLNNYTQEEYESTKSFCEAEGKYFVIGRETGDGGTPHLQGFVSLRERRNFDYVRNKLTTRCHIEGARGSARQNREYCIKDGDFIEGGNLPGRKSRDELAVEFGSAIRRGNSGLVEFSSANPGTWVFSGFNMLRNAQLIVAPIQRPSIQVEWIYGGPGVGKSRRAHATLPNAYLKEPRTKWWNGYLQEKEVIIDDFGPGGVDLNHLLRWFDRYKCLVENKGGMLALHADHFIVTSNFHPRDVYCGFGGAEHPQLEALLRRVSLTHME